MVGLVEHMLGVIGPVLLCAGVGFGLARTPIPFDPKLISPLVLNVATPALIISHLAEQHVDLQAFSAVVFAALIVLALVAVLGAGLLLAMRLSVPVFLGALMFSNTGNVGLPIVNLALGDQGMAFAMGYLIPGTVGVMTVGVGLAMQRLSFVALARTPVIYAIVIGVACMAFETPPPAPVQSALTILGGAAIPLMLLSLGYSIATLDLGDLKLGLLLALAHTVLAAVAAAITLQIVSLEGTARGAFLLEAMTPVGVTVYLIAQRYGSEKNARTIASIVLFSTLSTVIVIPLVLAFWV